MKTSTIVLLVVLALVATIISLFGWQNLATRVDLVLDLGPIGGWYLAKGFPVPVVLELVAFLVVVQYGDCGCGSERVPCHPPRLAALSVSDPRTEVTFVV